MVMNVGLLGLLGMPSAVIRACAPGQFEVLAVISDHNPICSWLAGGPPAIIVCVGRCIGAAESVVDLLLFPLPRWCMLHGALPGCAV